MSKGQYLKDNIPFIVAQLVIICVITSILTTFKASSSLILMVDIFIVLMDMSVLVLDYFRRRKYYKNIEDTLENMDKPQFIFPLIPTPYFYDAKEIWEILRVTTKAMNDEIALYKIRNTEYREYIERWIHEVKVPLSCISLLCDNNKSEVTDSIADESDKIEGYVEQALYYARSTNVEKDYTIKEISLDTMVKSALKKHSKQLISVNASIQINDLSNTVFTDPKWMEFILGQLISNSIKYKKDQLTIVFNSYKDDNSIVLEIADNGIGIPTQDVHRVFEKGFTGINGRKFAKSTGIGLYLCRQLCDKMCLGLDMVSKENDGVSIKIIFPLDKFIMFE